MRLKTTTQELIESVGLVVPTIEKLVDCSNANTGASLSLDEVNALLVYVSVNTHRR